MINHISKSTGIILVFVIFSSSCEFGDMMKDQFSILIELRKEFGGNWTNKLSNDCVTLEIVNSPRILNNPDSLDFYAAIIGRKISDKVENFKSCLELEIVDKTSAGIAYSSTSSTYSYNLELIKLFDDKPAIDVPNYLKASYAALSAARGDIDNAMYYREFLDSIRFKQDYIDLADALLAKQTGKKVDIDQFIADLNNQSDPQILHLLVESFKLLDEKEKAIELIKLSLSKDPENTHQAMMNGNYLFGNEAFEEASELFGHVIKQDPENLRAWHSRAWSKFKMGKEKEGCEDINQMYVIKPEVNMPDSTKLICQII